MGKDVICVFIYWPSSQHNKINYQEVSLHFSAPLPRFYQSLLGKSGDLPLYSSPEDICTRYLHKTFHLGCFTASGRARALKDQSKYLQNRHSE